MTGCLHANREPSKNSCCLCSWHLVTICQVTTNDTASGMGHGVASLNLQGVGHHHVYTAEMPKQGYTSCYRRVSRVCVHVPRACFLANEQMYKHVHTYSIHGFKQICHWFLNALFCSILSNRFFAVRSVIPCKNCSNSLKVCTLKQLVDFK